MGAAIRRLSYHEAVKRVRRPTRIGRRVAGAQLMLAIPFHLSIGVLVIMGLGLGVALLSKRVGHEVNGQRVPVTRPALGWVFLAGAGLFLILKFLMLLVVLDANRSGTAGGMFAPGLILLFPDIAILGGNVRASWTASPEEVLMAAGLGSLTWSGSMVLFACAFRRIIRG